MRVVFFGTASFAVPTLHALWESPAHTVLAVVTQPDRPQGRGGRLSLSPVKEAALAAGLPVLQPEKVRTKEFRLQIAALAPEVLVVAAFGQIISQRLLDLPPFGGINVHGSLLPRWRGAAPIQYALIAGDRETGVTTMQMDAGLDTGDMLLQASLPIDDNDTYGTLEPKLALLSAPLLLRTLDALGRGDCPRAVQDSSQATLAPSLHAEFGRLDLSQPAEILHNLVRGVTPKPGAFVLRDGRRLKIWRTEWQPEWEQRGAGVPGMIENVGSHGITLLTSRGTLRILEVQPEGKGRMAADAWARGARLAPGERFADE